MCGQPFARCVPSGVGAGASIPIRRRKGEFVAGKRSYSSSLDSSFADGLTVVSLIRYDEAALRGDRALRRSKGVRATNIFVFLPRTYWPKSSLSRRRLRAFRFGLVYCCGSTVREYAALKGRIGTCCRLCSRSIAVTLLDIAR